MNVVLHAEAVKEFDEAVDWYNRRQFGLGGEFAEEFERVVDRVLRGPGTFPFHPDDDKLRYCQTKRFPYLLLFAIEPDCIRIVTVEHASRQGGYWKDRLT